MRWQRGLCESLTMNARLLFHPRGGAAGWLAFPFMAIFECLGPLIEVSGYVFMIVCFALGMLSGEAFAVFLLVAIGFGVLLSVSALLLEEISFHVYSRPRDLVLLLAAVVLENFGYRQINSVFRLLGFVSWIGGKKGGWGEMTRNAAPQAGQ